MTQREACNYFLALSDTDAGQCLKYHIKQGRELGRDDHSQIDSLLAATIEWHANRMLTRRIKAAKKEAKSAKKKRV